MVKVFPSVMVPAIKRFTDNRLVDGGVGRSPILERASPDGVLIDAQTLYAITVDSGTKSAIADGNSFFKGRSASRLFKPHVAHGFANKRGNR